MIASFGDPSAELLGGRTLRRAFLCFIQRLYAARGQPAIAVHRWRSPVPQQTRVWLGARKRTRTWSCGARCLRDWAGR